jgi:hypothetical protein
MHKNKATTRNDLAVDALLVATCRTGELDADVSAKEAEALVTMSQPLTRHEQAAFQALGANFIDILRKRIENTKQRSGIGFVHLTREPVYATGLDQEGGVAESADKLRRARKRMRDFLGK